MELSHVFRPCNNYTYAQILKNEVIQSHDYLSSYHGKCEHIDDTSFYAIDMPLDYFIL